MAVNFTVPPMDAGMSVIVPPAIEMMPFVLTTLEPKSMVPLPIVIVPGLVSVPDTVRLSPAPKVKVVPEARVSVVAIMEPEGS